MLIGSEQVFGIQFEVSSLSNKNTLFGRIALWISGHCVGNFEEEIILHSFNDAFSYISQHNQVQNFANLIDFDEENVAKLLQTKCFDEDLISHLGESFDDFFLAVLHTNKKVVFCWRKTNKNNVECNRGSIMENIVSIDRQIFLEVFENYRQQLPLTLLNL